MTVCLFSFLSITVSGQHEKAPSGQGGSPQNNCQSATKAGAINIDPGEYDGWYWLRNKSKIKTTCVGPAKLSVEQGEYDLAIGNDVKLINLRIDSGGQIICTSDCSRSILIAGNRIIFKVVKLAFEPNTQKVRFYLSIYNHPLIQSPQKDGFMVRSEINIVPGLVYWVSPHGKGYGADISFRVGCAEEAEVQCTGVFSEIGNLKAARSSDNRRLMCFQPLKLIVTLIDSETDLFVGDTLLKGLKPLQSKEFWVIPNIPITIRASGVENHEKVFYANVMPYLDKVVVPDVVSIPLPISRRASARTSTGTLGQERDKILPSQYANVHLSARYVANPECK